MGLRPTEGRLERTYSTCLVDCCFFLFYFFWFPLFWSFRNRQQILLSYVFLHNFQRDFSGCCLVFFIPLLLYFFSLFVAMAFVSCITVGLIDHWYRTWMKTFFLGSQADRMCRRNFLCFHMFCNFRKAQLGS